MKPFITEKEIKYAAEFAMTNKEAAQLLKVSMYVWTKYSKLYTETNYNISYNEYLRKKRKLTKQPVFTHRVNKSILNILNGNHPTYNKSKLLHRLITEGHFLETCDMCGYCERNILNGKAPLILNCIDGDDTNFLRSNLQLLCYNCAYQMGYTLKIQKK